MIIQIHAQDFSLTDGVRDHVTRRLAYAMSHERGNVSRIVVRLHDINNFRGRMNKYCGIEVRIKGAPALIAEDVQPDLYTAIDRASERISRSVNRRLSHRNKASATSTLWQHAADEAA